MNINISVIIRFTRTMIEITDNEVTGRIPRLKMVRLPISSHEKTLLITSLPVLLFLINKKLYSFALFFIVTHSSILCTARMYIRIQARKPEKNVITVLSRCVLVLSLMKRKNRVRKLFISSFHKNCITEDVILSSL
jgi:hypothetical protein